MLAFCLRGTTNRSLSAFEFRRINNEPKSRSSSNASTSFRCATSICRRRLDPVRSRSRSIRLVLRLGRALLHAVAASGRSSSARPWCLATRLREPSSRSAGVYELEDRRPCRMEPGIPDCRTSRAEPPRPLQHRPGGGVRGRTADRTAMLTPYVVHPASYTFQAAGQCEFAEGAMVEPFATSMQSGAKAKIAPRRHRRRAGRRADRHHGLHRRTCRRLRPAAIADLAQPKLDIAAGYRGHSGQTSARRSLRKS